MSEMREKLARAILVGLRAADPEAFMQGEPDRMTIDGHFDLARVADAVLAALREPTDAMTHVGASALDHPSVFMGGPSHQSRRTAPRVWQAMIDEARQAGG